MSSTVRSLKGLVTKRNDAAVNWLQDSIQALDNIQIKEGARRIKTCDRYIELLETSLTKLTKAFDEAPDTTEEEEDHLDKYIEKTQATIMKLHDHRTRLEETQEEIGIDAGGLTSSAAVSNLPIIPIPTFTGRKWEWDNFWALYKANVHDQNLTQLQKFNYLLASLSGEAKQSISRFFVSANNYEKAIQHLAKRYGNKDGIVLELNRSLHNCVAKGPSTMEQRQLWDKLSTIAAQLEEHEQQLNNQLTIQLFVQKFHVRIRKAAMEKRLRHQDEHRPEWTLEQWLDAIDNIILQEEQLNHMLSYEGQARNYSLRGSTAARVPQESRETWRTGAPCERCGNKGHRWTTCPQIPTAIQKRRFLLETNRCLNCGSANHSVASCSSGNCRKCRKKHHTAICTQNTPREPKNSGKSKQHAVSRDTEEAAQGTFPVNEEASRTFGPETATTLLLNGRNTASSSLYPSSDKATAKTILSEDSSVKERTKRQAKSNVSLHSLESHNVEPLAKKALVTATSADIPATTTSKLLSSSSDSDTDTICPFSPAKSPAKFTVRKTRTSGTTMHRSRKKSGSEPQHQGIRNWMQRMNHCETLIRELEKGFETILEEIKKQHKKAQDVNNHREHHALARTTLAEDEAKEGHAKNGRHRRTYLMTSHRKSNTATSLQKESHDGQRKQILAGKKKGMQKWFKTDRRNPDERFFAGHAGVYELHSYQSTRLSKHRAKHSNVRDGSSDEKHRSGQRPTYKRPNSKVSKTRRPTRREELQATSGKSVLASEQNLGGSTEDMAHSTQSESGTQRGRIWSHITRCAPWQGAFYEGFMRCIKKTLYYTLGVLAVAFYGPRMTLTDMEGVEPSTAPTKAVSNQKRRKERTKKLTEQRRHYTALGCNSTSETAHIVQMDNSSEKAKKVAVVTLYEHRLQRPLNGLVPLEVDNGQYRPVQEQKGKTTRFNANQGKNQPKKQSYEQRHGSRGQCLPGHNVYLDNYFTISGDAPPRLLRPEYTNFPVRIIL